MKRAGPYIDAWPHDNGLKGVVLGGRKGNSLETIYSMYAKFSKRAVTGSMLDVLVLEMCNLATMSFPGAVF